MRIVVTGAGGFGGSALGAPRISPIHDRLGFRHDGAAADLAARSRGLAGGRANTGDAA